MDNPTAGKVTLLAIIAVAYLIWPLDLIPDVIPIAGLVDDLVVALLAGKGMMGSG